MTAVASPDEVLAPALARLDHAVAALIDPVIEYVQDRELAASSRYEQLCSEKRPSPQSCIGSGGRHAASRPAGRIDAIKLCAEIDGTTQAWSPAPGDTPQRLRRLVDRSWRPQDTARVTAIAGACEQWAIEISALLDPVSVKTLSAPCPVCGANRVYRQDDCGETVRQPALQIIAAVGCTCLACKAAWAPDQYLFLCRLLGFELPAGVLV
ncbi:hypothetical protein [Mycobacterium sp. 1274756.6]|uniref:DUF7340 domain-containing protein n=1 Tax=Mycobacterium sp. 1274756.6 TaxID=1834076 RepID=UPI0012E7B7D8|nr:hypothetical protein [Mycobacterium sp. 1274756.6]